MKETYHREMQAKIDELEKQMADIQSRIKTSGDAAHAKDYESHLADYQAKRDALVSKLNEMGTSHEDAWPGQKKEAEGIYSDLTKYFARIYAGSGGTGMF